ncbi:MAG TPA: 23S rRNA (uracil(1939)-C(5))-methyltransferase RlmD [Candidatus Nanopusillus sp.]|nr:23S rRNA (uracil(1939)-C(5))-methyltransferase RlmD [Candidatus Nanopusillus sp.]
MLCKHYGKCGGCQLQHLSYKKQLSYKVNRVTNLFKIEPEEIMPSPKIFYYRNRMDWVVGPNYEVGLKERGKWWAYVDINDCLLQSKESNIIRNSFREFIKEKKVLPWNTIEHTGLVRYIVIREGKFTDERMVTIVTYKTNEFEKYRNLWIEFLEMIKDYVSTVYWGVNPDLADVSYVKEKYLLWGNKYLREKLINNIYYILPNTFFQPNSYTAEILLKKAIELLEPKSKDTIFDLYSGIGTFSIEIAKYCNKVIGVDSDPETKELFYLNAKYNEIKNIEFMSKRVEELQRIKADKILLDPPRSGIHPKAIRLIGDSNANAIVYVSCNPKTQYRDIRKLESYGYSLERYILIDQFPHTLHIESIALLKK